jgi:multimeric flavodoxin WrbA
MKGAAMQKQQYTKEAEEALNTFLAPHPLITHAYHTQQIARSVEHYLLKENAPEVTKDILVKALEDRYPQNEPSTLRLKEPEKLMKTIKQQQAVDKENPMVKISRWPTPGQITAPPGKDVFAFYGGSRIGGNTDCIVDTVLDGVQSGGAQIEKVSFCDKNISPCTGCLGCSNKDLETHCVIKDDMPYIYKRFLECDAFVFGFPVYTGRESAQAAIFFDRLKALTDPWRKTKFKQRRGLVVATWGWPSENIYEGLVSQMSSIFFMFGVEVVEVVTGSGFWDAYYKKGTAHLDREGMARAREAGKALVST